MSDDFDGLDEELEQRQVSLVTAAEATDWLAPLSQQVEALVAGFAANRIRMTDPEQRAALVRMRAELDAVLEPLTLAKSTIDRVFLRYAVDAQAREVPIPGLGAVHYEPPKGQYVGQWAELRKALHAIGQLEGAPTPEEIDPAFTVVTEVKGNNTKLNALAKKYGGGVAEAIERHRTFVTPEAERGRVRFPEVKR